jgi:hypothetical protein
LLTNQDMQLGGAVVGSKELFDLSESSLEVEINEAGPQSQNRQFALELLRTDLAGGSLNLTVGDGVVGGYYNKPNGGYVGVGSSVGFGGVDRIRFRAVGAQVFYEYRRTGAWLTLGIVQSPDGIPLTDLRIRLVGHCFLASNCVGGTVVLDSLNMP